MCLPLAVQIAKKQSVSSIMISDVLVASVIFSGSFKTPITNHLSIHSIPRIIKQVNSKWFLVIYMQFKDKFRNIYSPIHNKIGSAENQQSQ